MYLNCRGVWKSSVLETQLASCSVVSVVTNLIGPRYVGRESLEQVLTSASNYLLTSHSKIEI